MEDNLGGQEPTSDESTFKEVTRTIVLSDRISVIRNTLNEWRSIHHPVWRNQRLIEEFCHEELEKLKGEQYSFDKALTALARLRRLGDDIDQLSDLTNTILKLKSKALAERVIVSLLMVGKVLEYADSDTVFCLFYEDATPKERQIDAIKTVRYFLSNAKRLCEQHLLETYAMVASIEFSPPDSSEPDQEAIEKMRNALKELGPNKKVKDYRKFTGLQNQRCCNARNHLIATNQWCSK